MESSMTDQKALRYTVVGGKRYWRTYDEAKRHPEEYRDGRVFRWIGIREGTYVELRT